METKQAEADGAFIAAAREDVPALAAEVRRLRVELQVIVRCGDSISAHIAEDALGAI